MANYSASGPTDFEWPPREDVLERQVFRIGDPIDPAPAEAHTGDRPPLSAVPIADDPLPEAPHVAEPRAREARETQAAPDPKIGSTPLRNSVFAGPAARKSKRAHAGAIALLALAAIAIVQAVYIVRTWSGGPLFSLAASEAQPPTPPLEKPAGERGRPVGGAGGTAAPAIVKGPPPAAKTAVDRTAAARSAPAPAPTRLMVRSDPPGARVSIDGRYRGVTPVGVNGLAPGEHRVVLERDGVEVRETIRLGPGGTVSLLAPMRTPPPAAGWISVESPIELDVFEDGSLVGTSRSSRILLQAGQHTLRLVNQDLAFRDVRQVEVIGGSVARVPVTLPKSEVLINASPWADVWIDGEHVGQTPIGRLTLTIGVYDVVFRHPDLGEKKTTAIVEAGAPTRVTINMRP